MMIPIVSAVVFLSCLGQSLSAEWRWTGKVAVVTGASSGIGAEVALQLAERGVIVVGLARRDERIAELAKITNGTIYALKCDLLVEEQVQSAFRWIESTLGGVDILVNNAGTIIISSLITGQTSDWKTVLDLNVLSLSICTREALTSMRTRGDDGHIININSVAGHRIAKVPNFPSAVYSASKFAVTALTQSLTFELAQEDSRIKVTSLSPGIVDTELFTNISTKFIQENPNAPINNLVKPHLHPIDIADAVICILSTRRHVQISELTIEPIVGPVCATN